MAKIMDKVRDLRAKLYAGGVIAGSAFVGSSAFAQSGGGVDTSSVTGAISSATTAGGVIGLAVLAMVAGIKLFKWVKGAM